MLYMLFFFLFALGHHSNGLPQGKVLYHDTHELLQLTSESRIVGGSDAPDDYAPHMAALLYGRVLTTFFCGGSIIAKKLILSAAHCIDAARDWTGGVTQSLHGNIGSNRWDDSNSVVEFSGFVNHPQWDPVAVKNDIGILIVSVEIELSPRVAVLSLQFEPVGGGEEVYVAGWGRVGLSAPTPAKLQLLYLTTLSAQQCQDDMDEITKVWGPALPLDSKVEICTFHSCGKGMCHGDSGSAVVLKSTGMLVGVVSWGFPCALGAPDVHARVSGVADFFKSVLDDHA